MCLIRAFSTLKYYGSLVSIGFRVHKSISFTSMKFFLVITNSFFYLNAVSNLKPVLLSLSTVNILYVSPIKNVSMISSFFSCLKPNSRWISKATFLSLRLNSYGYDIYLNLILGFYFYLTQYSKYMFLK